MIDLTNNPPGPADRTCAMCACVMIQSNPQTMQKMFFCRRNTPISGQMRVDVPRLDREGKIINGRDGKPLMEQQQQLVFTYPPVPPEFTCFDGWRPIGTLPGEDTRARGMRKLLEDVKGQEG